MNASATGLAKILTPWIPHVGSVINWNGQRLCVKGPSYSGARLEIARMRGEPIPIEMENIGLAIDKSASWITSFDSERYDNGRLVPKAVETRKEPSRFLKHPSTRGRKHGQTIPQ